jgi:hypothetical protein
MARATHALPHLHICLPRFRVNKKTFQYIVDAVTGHPLVTRKSYRRHQTVDEQVATCLVFLATGGSYTVCGDACGWSKTTVHRCVTRVSKAIVERLGPGHVRFPRSSDEVQRNVAGFKALADGKWGRGTCGIPQVVGAADGSHVPIRKPDHSGDAYINRKGYFSTIVHAICDHEGRFIDVFAGYSGRCHDMIVVEASPFWGSLCHGWVGDVMKAHTCRIGNAVVPLMLLGDAAYGSSPFFLPSFKEPELL